MNLKTAQILNLNWQLIFILYKDIYTVNCWIIKIFMDNIFYMADTGYNNRKGLPLSSGGISK